MKDIVKADVARAMKRRKDAPPWVHQEPEKKMGLGRLLEVPPKPIQLPPAGRALARAVARIVDREEWEARLWVWSSEVPAAMTALKAEGFKLVPTK